MTESQNIKFVLEIEKYPCLYNSTLGSYSLKSKTSEAWEQVGRVMNMTSEECKDRWRNVRTVLTRHIKSLSGNKKKRGYYLFDYMQYVIPYLKLTPEETAYLPSSSNTGDVIHLDNTWDTNMRSQSLHADETNQSNILFIEQAEDPISSNTQYYDEAPIPKRMKQESGSIKQFAENKSRGSEAQAPNEAVTSFLESLAPELHEMNVQQFKTFKRRVLALIDDIVDSNVSQAATI